MMIASGMGAPPIIIAAAVAPDSVAVVPTERSKSPTTITIVCATAMIARMAIW